jgi:ADP-ribose pyrophosphatase YjhB (NUDIX family)
VRDILVAAALIRRADMVLLVEQQGPRYDPASWALPGGRAKPGESVVATLRREVREETGPDVRDAGQLLHVTQAVDQLEAVRVTIFIFDVTDWRGELAPADPDAYILRAEFVPVADALTRLSAGPWPSMHEPICAYLSGAAPTADLWLYERGADGVEQLTGRVPLRR